VRVQGVSAEGATRDFRARRSRRADIRARGARATGDDGVHGFYAAWGYQDLPFDPRRAMIVRMVELDRRFGTSS
jgi:hypothetical protein